MKFTCKRAVSATEPDGETCEGQPRNVTDHLYYCPACHSHHWKRPRSKHFPNGEHVIFGWGDYRNDPEAEAKETSATFGAMWELLDKLEQREKMIEWYEAHCLKLDAEKRTLEALLRVAASAA